MLKKLRYKYLNFWSIATLILLLFFALALVYPLINMLLNSFKGAEGGFTLENYIKFFTKKYYYSALKNSLTIGVLSTLISTVVGVALSYVVHRYNIVFKGALKMAFIICLMSPPFIGAYSWILLCGRSGVITNLLSDIGVTLPPIYGKTGILLVFSLSLSCYVFRYVLAALKGIDRSLEEAAESLGASKLRRIFTVSLPVVLPVITSVMIIVFMRSLADFGTKQELQITCSAATTIPWKIFPDI